MQSFTKPANLDGATLIAELETAGIAVTANGLGVKCPIVDGHDSLWLDIVAADKPAAVLIVKNHKG
jgi:hypothetical protein